MAASDTEAIGNDPNFQRLSSRTTKPEKFKELLEAHVGGYSQKRRVLDGLKELIPRVEAVKTKVQISKQLGKAKAAKLELAEHALDEAYDVPDLQAKVQLVNGRLQADIEEGRLSTDEHPRVLEELQARLETAKADGKEKLQQKLERQIESVSSAKPMDLPLEDVLAMDALKKRLRGLQSLEKKAWDALSEHEQKKLEEKPQIAKELSSMEERNRMWFETDKEFKHRLEKALGNATLLRLEQKRLEEKAASPQLRPQPQAKKKDKPKFTKLDPHELFAQQEQQEEEAAPAPAVEEPATQAATEAEDGQEACQPSAGPEEAQPAGPGGAKEPGEPEGAEVQEPERPAPAEGGEPAERAGPAEPAEAAEAAEAAAPPSPAVVQEPAAAGTAEPPAPSARQDQPAEADGDFPPPMAAAKAAPAKKAPQPQPKKAKKKFTKLDPSQLGFD